MAVLAERRGAGIGQQLMTAILTYLSHKQIPLVQLHAQIQARSFYEKCGFHQVGDAFAEAGILHVQMCQVLAL
jgi:predicted GNAT family N-acyltransferase